MGASIGALQIVTILLRLLLQSRAGLAAENLALRQQVAVLQRSVKHRRLHRRDRIYGSYFGNRARGMGIKEVLIAPRSPWQSPFVERRIGSIRRECLDHVLVIHEAHLRRVLREYFADYPESRPHQSLQGNAPRPRKIEPPSQGRVVAEAQVGGLHHRYRRAA